MEKNVIWHKKKISDEEKNRKGSDFFLPTIKESSIIDGNEDDQFILKINQELVCIVPFYNEMVLYPDRKQHPYCPNFS